MKAAKRVLLDFIAKQQLVKLPQVGFLYTANSIKFVFPKRTL